MVGMNADLYQVVRLPRGVIAGTAAVSRRLSSFKKDDFGNGELYAPSMHLLRRKGKLMRPTLVLLGAHMLGRPIMDYIDLAASAELMHTSSLVHDDIIDRDLRRRRLPSVHSKYGIESAILAGDALISKSIAMSSGYGKEVLTSISNAARDMCAGEMLDYKFQKERRHPKVGEYVEIAMLKSASLIASCCNAVAVHRNDRRAQSLYDFGRNMGVAFQMRDDLLDTKDAFRPNIVTTLEAHERLNEKEARMYAIELQQRYIDKAITALGNGSDLLAEYADAIRVR